VQPFHDIIHVWDFGWDNVYNTVPPSEVNKAVLKFKDKYRDKRKIVHYVQPHHPFLSDSELLFGGPSKWRNQAMNKETESIYHIWDLVRRGVVPVQRVRKAYEGNLKIVLEKVDDLIGELEGKIVLTSDHGNCFGEWGLFGHPEEIRVKPLVEIPWLEIQ
jgi:hypothetical protein